MDTSDSNEAEKDLKTSLEFKKPILVGRVGKLPHKVPNICENQNKPADVNKSDVSSTSSNLPPAEKQDENPSKEVAKKQDSKGSEFLSPAESLKESLPLPYKEPKWSGLPPQGSGYRLEVLKSGMIIDTIDLSDKPFHVFGRLSSCDIKMANPTISRYHALVQYKAKNTDDDRPNGFYIYDLGSSHGTVKNKIRLKPKVYVRFQVGHLLKLGCSTRLFILQGPDDDREEESELSLTEMKELRKAKKEQIEKEKALEKLKAQKEEEEREKKAEQEGISWGMAEDAEEETDLTENPYAQSTNEELYLDDPKKTLRGYFEREGYDLEYRCDERGVGQFVCRVELPIEDATGKPIIAEVIHKGKKKDAVVQCALEACRIIDRHGLLRQAKHESRKRKSKNWKDDDFYDSDDDTFLDRTGMIEKKREKRMKEFEGDSGSSNVQSQSNKALTYNEILEQCKELREKIEGNERKLAGLRNQNKSKTSSSDSNSEVDALDEFMSNLGKQNQSMAHKTEISKTKMDIQKLKYELEKAERLAEIARPTNLPPLLVKSDDTAKSAVVKKTDNTIFIGKKITKSVRKEIKRPENVNVEEYNDKFEVEVDSDEEIQDDSSKIEDKLKDKDESVKVVKKSSPVKNTDDKSKVFGPMRPPSNYVIPEGYFDQENDRDLPEITEEEN